MEIRQMKAGEADDISRIYASSWRCAYRGIVPQAYLDRLSELRWSALLAENPSKSFVLLEAGKFVGTSSVSPARDEKLSGWGEIISLYLLPEYFGKGYGKALFQHSVRELNRRGFENIYLWTLEGNRRARAFYEKHGFAPDGGTISCEIGGKALAEVRYVHTGK